jgi:hypothetical protein
MAKKLSLKLKKKGDTPAAAPAAAAAGAPPMAAGGGGSFTIELRGAVVNVEEVILRKKK